MNITTDKYKHFLAGSIAAFITTLFVSAFNQNLFAILFTGAFVSMGWEIYQR